jgi:acyl-CoA dehydrogenase
VDGLVTPQAEPLGTEQPLPLFELTEELRAFRDTYVGFLSSKVVPRYSEFREAQSIPREIYREAAELGFLGMYAPEEFGGAAATDLAFGLLMVYEAAARGCLGFAAVIGMHATVCTPFLTHHGTAAQKRRWLDRLVAADTLAVAMCDGDAIVGADADLVFVRVGRDADTAVLITPIADAGERISLGRVHAPLGMAETPTATLIFDERPTTDAAVVDDTDTLGALHDIAWAAAYLGACRAAIGWTSEYAAQRRVFGRPLIELENPRHQLQRMTSAYERGAASLRDCLAAHGSGTGWAQRCRAANDAAAEAHWRSVDEGLQLHGGYGYMREYPIALAYADAAMVRTMRAAAR